jgi:predicted AAA+ superfamily ATPase
VSGNQAGQAQCTLLKSGRTAAYRRWSNSYSQRLIRENIRELSEIRAASDLENLYHLLPSKIGRPLSVPSLANDLKASYNTVQNWLTLFERFYLTFSLPTWTERIARAIHKERKAYLFDTPRIKDPAAQLENMVAIELWHAVTCWNAMGGGTKKEALKRDLKPLLGASTTPIF